MRFLNWVWGWLLWVIDWVRPSIDSHLKLFIRAEKRIAGLAKRHTLEAELAYELSRAHVERSDKLFAAASRAESVSARLRGLTANQLAA